MNITSKRFKFPDGVDVPSARDQTKSIRIPEGVLDVVFDDPVSVSGRPVGTECDVRQSNVSSGRILREDLEQLCQSCQAVPLP